MSRRYLFGPANPEMASHYLQVQHQSGLCRTFDLDSAGGLAIRPDDTWESICARLPDDWRPDLVVLYLSYRTIPRCLWKAPVPIVGLAADWNLLWHQYRHQLPQCDLVLIDRPGVAALARAGITHVKPAALFACPQSFLDGPWPEVERDIDVLFVGNTQSAVQRERLSWLGRLSSLSPRWKVVIRTGVFGEEYRQLLGRARIVFNRSVRGECNLRVYEAAAAGALLFQEAENEEVPHFFQRDTEYVSYTADNLEELLEHYLEHEVERQAIADAARVRVQQYSYESLWTATLDQIEAEWDELQNRARQRCERPLAEDLPGRCWQDLGSIDAEPTLANDLAHALVTQPRSAALHHALGIAIARGGLRNGPMTAALAEQAAGYFRRAVTSDPGHVMAGLSLTAALAALSKTEEAVAQARHTLTALDRQSHLSSEILDAGCFPPAFDLFRVEWERAGAQHAGCPAAEERAKRELVRWRLHALLADLTDEPVHYHEAALSRPDLPATRAALGCALARVGRVPDALSHLRQAVEANPFDHAAARALFEAMSQMGDEEGRRRLARDRRLLAQAALDLVPAESWFADTPPPGDELASLIILCHNQVEYTRLCLESVLAHTRAPYELILVDNGSNDGTAAYLDEVRARPGPERVVVLRNETNLGFAAGCNQGLKAAHGDYLVLLNNDTIVPPNWLEGLVAWALHDWPSVGLVGPVSNYAPPPQHVAADYRGPEGVAAFAARRAQEQAHRAVQVDRLTGFCLLIRRDVLTKVGLLDEGYGLGFFEDDDLCVRAREAGFRLLVALNVFVHHFGSRTFEGLGIDTRQHLEANFDRFRAKWGPERAAGYRLPELPVPSAPIADPPSVAVDVPTVIRADPTTNGHPHVSLCMIVKNEEANLPDCLGSVADLVDEMIVVDTGSSDQTREIAARFGAKVHDFPWVDSFAAARNESLRHAAGDWVFWLDADDRLDEDNRVKLRHLLAELPDANTAYVMKCLCLPDPATGTATVVDHVRLFRNDPSLRWKYRIHEQILPALRATEVEVRWADVVVQHTGYLDPRLRRKKLERDLRLLRLEDQEHPDDPFTLFNLGMVYQELGQLAEAVTAFQRSLQKSHPNDSIVRKLYALLVQCHRQLDQAEESRAACRAGLSYYPEDAELLFQEGLVLREQGDAAGAEARFLQLLQAREGEHFASVDTGLRGYKARHNLAVLYREQGRPAEAEAQWQAALAEAPGFVVGWAGLGELYLGQERWSDLEKVLSRLRAHPSAALEAAVLTARVHLARKEFAPARQILEQTLEAQRHSLVPRVVLSHVLLQEGKDWEAAERMLREVLTREPGHAEARHNLAVLLRQRGPALDRVFDNDPSLTELYQFACQNPSDINEHLPTLYQLARQCSHVTEMGTRTAVSTTALLYAQPDKLVCYDKVKFPEVDVLGRLVGRTEFVFRQADVLQVEIEETDLLFIDTWHVYEQLQTELRLHAGKVRKYIVLHDTSTYGHTGESPGHRGIWKAVEEFLAQGSFRIKERFNHNHGLTILEAVRPG